MSHRAALSIAFLLSACVVADEAVGTQAQAIEGSCDEFLCGANSPLLGGLPFWEVDNQPNAAAALSITKVTDPHGVTGKLVVNGAQVTFVAPATRRSAACAWSAPRSRSPPRRPSPPHRRARSS